MNVNATVDYRNTYGTHETNGLVNGVEYHKQERKIVDWTQPGLKITRLRLLGDLGFPYYDVSYCHGVVNGENVEVQLPFNQVPKRGMTAFLVKQAIMYGVYAKGIGLLDSGNHSILL